MEDIKIIKAKPEDFKEVYKLIIEFATFMKLSDKVRISVDQMMKEELFFKSLIAIHGKETIGFATYFFAYYSWTGKAIYLDDLYVKEAYRNKGVGTKLFDKIIEMGKSEHCYKVKWQVSNWNSKAQEFYKAKGAVIDEVEINCDLILTDL